MLGWLAFSATALAQQQAYPSKPIRLVLPFAAGGGADNNARIIAEPLAQRLGQPIIIDYKPGAGGTLGANIVANAKTQTDIAQGISHIVGSVEVGKLADLVLFKPALFGVKPEIVLKGGFVSWANMGDPNASIPTPQPTFYRPMWGAAGGALSATNITFVSAAALHSGRLADLGLRRRLEPVVKCRNIGKRDMVLNDAMPVIKVDPAI
jgi:urease subunit alpha